MLRTGLYIFLCTFFSLTGFSQSKKIRITTNLGDMTFMLYDDTPGHRDAFLKLADEGYYNGTLFFRVIRDFLIQGGSKSSKNAPPGKLIGFETLDKIAALKTDNNNRPLTDVKISVTVLNE